MELEPAARALLGGGGGGADGPPLGEIYPNIFCVSTDTYHGEKYEKIGAQVMLWLCFSFCVMCLIFYAYHSWKATTGWEEVYVCVIERKWQAGTVSRIGPVRSSPKRPAPMALR